MAFTKGTANFTNGSKVVTGVSLTSGQLAYFASGTAVFVQSEGQLIEATGLPKDGNGDVIPSQFLLRGNWTGATGSYEFVAFDTIEGLRDAVQSARGFSNQFITLRQEQSALLKLYDSEADGLGSTLDGDYFNVVSANPDIYTALYINDGGTAILIGNMPTAAALNAATQAASESATSASQAAEDADGYRTKAQEWAENPEDAEVETEQFSALHWSAKALGYSTISAENSTLARKWAEEAENTEVAPGSYSARHWSAKAEAFAASINPTVEATGSTALQRTEDGRGKVADGVEPDDALAMGQLPDDVANLFARNNIVGSVGESAGVPTGAIIEYDSNSDGEYVKLADGTMISWYEDTTVYTTDEARDSVFFANIDAVSFPHAFLSPPKVTGYSHRTNISGYGLSWSSMTASDDITTATETRVFIVGTDSSCQAAFGYIAIGRWAA